MTPAEVKLKAKNDALSAELGNLHGVISRQSRTIGEQGRQIIAFQEIVKRQHELLQQKNVVSNPDLGLVEKATEKLMADAGQPAKETPGEALVQPVQQQLTTTPVS